MKAQLKCLTLFLALLLCVAPLSGCGDTATSDPDENQLEQQIAALSAANQTLTDAVAALSADREAAAQSAARLEEQIAALKQTADANTTDTDTAAAQAITQLKEEIAALTASNKSLSDTVAALRAESETAAQTAQQLQQQIAALDANRSSTAQSIRQLESKILSLTDENRALADTLKSLQTAVDSLKAEIAQLKASGSGSGTVSLSIKKASNPITAVYTKAELEQLARLSLDDARSYISTAEDAAHYLALLGFKFYTGTSSTEVNLSLSHAKQKIGSQAIAANTVTSAAAYLLRDDYSEIGYIVAPVKADGSVRGLTGLYIRHADAYQVLSVSHIMRNLGYKLSSQSADFQTVTVSRLGDVPAKIVLTRLGKGTTLPQVWTAEYQENLSFAISGNLLTKKTGNATELWRLSDAELAKADREQTQQVLKALMAELEAKRFTSKGPTITVEQALALVDSGLDNVKKTCKSLEDVLLYLTAVGSKQTSGDLQTKDASGAYTWHFNYSPQSVYRMKASNCGGTASFVAYLLEGDYDEVGMLAMRADSGGHVINYFRDGTKWFSVDVNSFHGGAYTTNRLGYNPGSDLISVGRSAAQKYSSPYKSVIAAPHLTSSPAEGDIPVGWDSSKVVRIPQEYRAVATIILENPAEGFTFEWVTVPAGTQNIIDAMRNG